MSDLPEDNPRLTAAIEDFYQARRPGAPLEIAAFLAKHSDVADDLKAFLGGVECVDRHISPDRLSRTAPCIEDARADAAAFPELEGYAIECEIGNGGMGIVYRARQHSTGRLVALKMIRSGRLASTEERQRFQVEVKAAAALEHHPNIVPVYDVQIKGRHPYYTMQLLEGGPLSKRLQQYRRTPTRAAEVIFQIAGAVDLAHRSGVLHRDVKPDNILFDAAGRPHLTDFGLAKRQEGDDDLTDSRAVVGAVNYMSPEQAAGRSKTATTAADIYSLGATLYALLAGKAPFASESKLQTLQLVQTTQPVPPRRLNSNVPRDLEVICLKCLEKEPADRYNTAGELADDLRCFLHKLPIRARPLGMPARLWRWGQRNRAIAILLILVLATLTGGLIVSTLFGLDAERQRQRAESSYRLSRKAIEKSMRLIREDPRLTSGPLEGLRRHILNAQLEYHKEFVQLHGNDPTFLADLGTSYLSLGNGTRDLGDGEAALPHLREGVRIFRLLTIRQPGVDEHRKKLAEAYGGLASALAGLDRYAEAESAGRERLRIREFFAQASASETEDWRELANALSAIGEIQSNQERFDAAETNYRRALAIYRQIASEKPESESVPFEIAGILNSLGYICQSTGRLEQAEGAYSEARQIYVALGPADPANELLWESLSWVYENSGHISVIRGEDAAAVPHFEAAIKIRERLAQNHPAIAAYTRTLADVWSSLGDVQQSLDRFSDAKQAHSRALDLVAQLGPLEANSEGARSRTAYALFGLGRDDLDAGDLDARNLAAAEQSLRQSIEIFGDLVQQCPDKVHYASNQASALSSLARLLRAQERRADAEEAVRKAIDILASLRRQQPHVAEYRESLADACESLADLLALAGRLDEAEAAALKGLKQREEWDRPESRSALARSREGLARLYVRLQKFQKAEIALRDALRIRQLLADEAPDSDIVQRDLAMCYYALGFLQSDCGAFEAAWDNCLEAALLSRKVTQKNRPAPSTPLEIADDEIDLGCIARWSRHFTAAVRHLDLAVSTLVPLHAGNSEDKSIRSRLVDAHANRALALNMLERHEECLEEFDQAIDLSRGKILWLRVDRALTLVRLSRFEEATAAIDSLNLSGPLTPNVAFTVACVLSRCSAALGDNVSRAESLASAAVEHLRRAIADGFCNLEFLEKSADLDTLRARSDFPHTLAELRAPGGP